MEDKMLRNADALFNMVHQENLRQLKKWGVQNCSPFEWLAYATEEHGEMAKAICEQAYRGGPASNIVAEAIQTATLCLKIAEMYMEDTDEQG